MAEMKDSGIHAIGRIPKEWNVVRTKYLSNISIGLVTTMTENYVEKEEGVPLIRNGNIRCNKIDVNGMVFLDKRFAEKNKHRQLHTGQIATVHTGDVGTSIVIPEEYDGGLGFATIQSTPYKGVSSEFLCWFYNSAAFKNQCIECSTGDGRQNLNLYDFVDLFVAIPKYDLQSKIASFLDKKCAEIDSLHTDIEKQIETLEEYKKSIITEAVTKGLDPDVEMKDSGISVYDKLPITWNLCRIKDCCQIVRGGSPRPINNYMSDNQDDINWIKISDTTKGHKYIDRTEQKIKKIGMSSSRLVHKGDLLLTNSMSFGQPYILNIDGCIHDGWLAFSQYKNISKEFLFYTLMSELCAMQFVLSVSGSVVVNLNIDKVGETRIFIPNMEKQKEIVSYLDYILADIKDVIEEKKEQLETLEQYKKSLIYEYVTGKKEVK